jgi:ATP-dependent DNA helicase RecG
MTFTKYTKTEIDELIQQGENSAVEFKSQNVRSESIAKELVALSNAQGGTILIGVEDDGTVSGVDNPEKVEEFITNIARTSTIPSVEIEIYSASYDVYNIVFVNVVKGKDRPYQTNNNQFLTRVGSTNRALTQGELMRLFQQTGIFHYDATGVTGTAIKDLNLAKLDQYFSQYDFDLSSEDNKQRVLSNVDIMTEEGEVTVAGLLVFGLNPQRWLHFAEISFAHFEGEEIGSELIDKQVISGTIDFQVDSALSVIRNNMRRSSDIEGAKRVDQESYPEKIFRELLVNAVVHRNYSISGSRVRIQQFSDRIEFISPGRLPNSVTIEKLSLGVSYAVNPVILKFMENQRYIDKLGRGLPMVYNAAKKLGKRALFEEYGEEFKVVLPLEFNR